MSTTMFEREFLQLELILGKSVLVTWYSFTEVGNCLLWGLSFYLSESIAVKLELLRTRRIRLFN